MNEDGVPVANFNWSIINFDEPSARFQSANPRMCFAIRLAGSQDKYDILYQSMLRWSEGKWLKKDGLTDDPKTFCETTWDNVEAETI